MNTNSLEQFILNNRAQFDVATPPQRAWIAIEQALNHPNTNNCQTVAGFIADQREAFNTAEPNDRIWLNIEKYLNQQQRGETLESFIQTNRESFDDTVPSFRVWSEIDTQIRPKVLQKSVKVVSIWRSLRVAAAILLLLSAGAASGIYFTKSQMNSAVASLEDVSTEYAEAARYYNAQISDKIKLVSAQNGDETVLEDLETIDQSMAELEAELQKAPKGAEEQIVANLIKSYQIKLDILERVLERIQSTKKDSTTQKRKDNEVSI